MNLPDISSDGFNELFLLNGGEVISEAFQKRGANGTYWSLYEDFAAFHPL